LRESLSIHSFSIEEEDEIEKEEKEGLLTSKNLQGLEVLQRVINNFLNTLFN